jgi:hypothetical protein
MKFLIPLLLAAAASAGSPAAFRVEVDFTTLVEYRMGDLAKGQLEREIYFRSYGNLGAHATARNAELVEIGAPPGRGTIFQNLQPAEDGLSFTANSETLGLTDAYTRFNRTAQFNQLSLPHAVALNRYPDWMLVGNPDDPGGLLEDWERQSQNTVLRPDLYASHADYLGRLYADLQAFGSSVSLPAFYSPINEPFWRWERAGLAEYHVAVKNAFQARGVGIKVAGPTAAWPLPLTDFRVWTNTYRRFVQGAGGALDAFDFHFYSKGDWSLPPEPEWQDRRVPEPSLFESQRLGVGTVWDYGRLEGYLDLLAGAQKAYWPQRPHMPLIISEFGRQGIHPQFGPWENDFKPWLYMTTVIRQWMVYWQRPEVRLTIPFIMSMSGRTDAQSRGQAIFNQPDYPESTDYQPTRFREFYQFFRDLAGEYATVKVRTAAGAPDPVGHIRAAAFRDGDTGYLVLHNAKGFPRHPVEVDIRNHVPVGTGNPVAEWKRLFYAGEVPEPDSAAPLEGALTIEPGYQPLPQGPVTLSGEATVIVRYTWPAPPPRAASLVEERFLSADTMMPLQGQDTVVFSVDLPAGTGDWKDSRVEIGLARDGGFSIGPCVLVNGVVVGDLPVLAGRGVADWHAVVPLEVPPGLWAEGPNLIELQFEGHFRHGHPHAVTAGVVGVR